MQVLIKHSGGRTYGYPYQIGTLDWKGLKIEAYLGMQDGPCSSVFFG